MEKRTFSAEQRDQLADEGKALPDGAYPIVTMGDLNNAIQSWGRRPTTQLKRHLLRNARRLGASQEIIDRIESLGNVAKVDTDRGIVFGWANVSLRSDGTQIEDSQGDLIDPDDLEDAAYLFNLSYRETGEMHQGDVKGRLIESMVFTEEKIAKLGLDPDTVPVGWWIGVQIDDPEVFQKVKAGHLSMFSIQGRAVREDVV